MVLLKITNPFCTVSKFLTQNYFLEYILLTRNLWVQLFGTTKYFLNIILFWPNRFLFISYRPPDYCGRPYYFQIDFFKAKRLSIPIFNTKYFGLKCCIENILGVVLLTILNQPEERYFYWCSTVPLVDFNITEFFFQGFENWVFVRATIEDCEAALNCVTFYSQRLYGWIFYIGWQQFYWHFSDNHGEGPP